MNPEEGLDKTLEEKDKDLMEEYQKQNDPGPQPDPLDPDNENLKNNLNNQIAGNVAGTGLEVGTGIATDALTNWMLFAGPWGWLGYGVTNFASGATSNYAAQKLRGIEDIGWGEVISSGLIDMVPGLGGRAKGLKAVRNYALEGAGRTLAQQQAQVGIDEQRFLTPGETVTSTALGGTFGAGFGGIGVGASKLKSTLTPTPVLAATDDALFDLNRQQAGLKMRLMNSIDPESNFGVNAQWPRLSKHYQDKLAVHNRALNGDMIGWDQRALNRRSKIDEQFQINPRTNLPEGPHIVRAGSTEAGRRAKLPGVLVKK